MTGTTRPSGIATAMPTFALGWRSIASPVKRALTARWRMSAAAQALVRMSVSVGFGSPSPASSARRARSSWARVMSADIEIWNAGASQASVSRRATVRRNDESGSTSTSPDGAGAARPARGWAAPGPLDVLGDDPPLGAGAGERGEFDPALARDPAGERRGLDATAVAAGRPAAWSPRRPPRAARARAPPRRRGRAAPRSPEPPRPPRRSPRSCRRPGPRPR